jgi:hypothetical protein
MKLQLSYTPPLAISCCSAIPIKLSTRAFLCLSVQNKLLLRYPAVKAAFELGQDLVYPIDYADDHYDLLPTPAVLGVAAVLDATGAVVTPAIPAVAAYIGLPRYPRDAANHFTEASFVKKEKDKARRIKEELRLTTEASQAMSSVVATIPAPLLLEIHLNSPDSSAAMATYSIFTFVLCVLEALTITSANNAANLIKKILFPTFEHVSASPASHQPRT